MRSFPRTRKTYTGQLPPVDVDLTPIMCLFIILVPMLLLTAVFERLAALKVRLPQASTLEARESPLDPSGIVELRVLVQEAGLAVEATLSHEPSGEEMDLYRDIRYEVPLQDGQYDMPTLQSILKDIKSRYPKHEEAVLLVEDAVSYDTMVQTMDTCREEFFLEDGERKRHSIFPIVVLSETFAEEKGFEGLREGTRAIDRELGLR